MNDLIERGSIAVHRAVSRRGARLAMRRTAGESYGFSPGQSDEKYRRLAIFLERHVDVDKKAGDYFWEVYKEMVDGAKPPDVNSAQPSL
jgi:hypothetical protein